MRPVSSGAGTIAFLAVCFLAVGFLQEVFFVAQAVFALAGFCADVLGEVVEVLLVIRWYNLGKVELSVCWDGEAFRKMPTKKAQSFSGETPAGLCLLFRFHLH